MGCSICGAPRFIAETAEASSRVKCVFYRAPSQRACFSVHCFGTWSVRRWRHHTEVPAEHVAPREETVRALLRDPAVVHEWQMCDGEGHVPMMDKLLAEARRITPIPVSSNHS